MGVPTNYTLGEIKTYPSGGGFYHAQCAITLVDYNGYTGPAYLFITIPDVAEELALFMPDPYNEEIAGCYDDCLLGEFFKQDLKHTPFAQLYVDMLNALDDDFGHYQNIWLDKPLTPGGDTEVEIADYVDYLNDYFGFTQLGGHQLEYDFDAMGNGTITSSTTPRYMANMVTAETQPEPEYLVEGFFDNRMRGLDASITTFDFDAAIDYAHTLASSGDYIKLTNELTGEYVTFTADEWMDAVEFGEIPSDVYTIE